MIEFYKYHGAGNHFIIIDNLAGKISFTKDQVVALCDRHYGIGADGLILVESSSKADCFMNYYNGNGSLAEMCGNGVRCLAKFFLEQTGSGLKELSVDTRAGIKKVVCNEDGSFSVNMGAPLFSHADFPDSPLTLENILLKFVSMGNPHAVGLVKNISDIDLSRIGPKIENDPHFRNKINVEFVEKVANDYFKVKVWERGSGATLACGSGACAVYAVLKNENKDMEGITLQFPGGNLYLSQNNDRQIILRGPAMCVFEGEVK